jgi:hypothetical protein
MFKNIVLSVLIVSPIFGAGKLAENKIYAPARLGTVSVEHTPYGFTVNNKPVQPQHMDKELRTITAEKLTTALRNGYIQVDQSCNGEYKLEMQGRLQGGGFGGAAIGFWIGKVGVYALSYGTISLISACTGPLAKGTFVTLTKFCAGPIEVASNKAAIGLGITFGAATGPV